VPETPVEIEKPKVNIATKQEIPTPKPASTPTPTSLNDRISNQKIQVGLNDRIAFVKHLFNFSQEDFNRVLSQLNTFTSEFECKDFIENKVKPDYNWEDKEEYEARLIALVERKFK
jgi:ABC-type transporter Mla subunit MlaD